MELKKTVERKTSIILSEQFLTKSVKIKLHVNYIIEFDIGIIRISNCSAVIPMKKNLLPIWKPIKFQFCLAFWVYQSFF